jgi:hypothetical protein
VVTIYAAINRRSKKRYIGSTEQVPEARWGQHKRELRRGIHHAKALQADWNEHGEGAFLFAVLRVVTTKERRWAEQQEIDAWVAAHGREALYNETTLVH